MILTAAIVAILVIAYLAAAWQAHRLGLGLRQACFYLPFKLAYRIDDDAAVDLRKAEAPVIYAVSHQSKIDPALALALLPPQTLHILDQDSATAAWLEPWRELARTIGFNAEHLFVNRRLVRHLRGKGRLAVYIPAGIRPDTKEFRLYRAISRIADNSGATVVPVSFEGDRSAAFPRLVLRTLPPLKISDLAQNGSPPGMSHALFSRVEQARLRAAA